MTQTRVGGETVVRFQVGQFDVTEADLDVAYQTLVNLAGDA